MNNFLTTESQISFANEICSKAKRNESLSQYTDDELRNSIYFAAQHLEHIDGAIDDSNFIFNISGTIKKEKVRRENKRTWLSNLKWTLFGTFLGILLANIPELFLMLFTAKT